MTEVQHREAIAGSLVVTKTVSCRLYDDKVRDMGRMDVSNGEIKVKLDYLPMLISQEAVRSFVLREVGLAVEACFNAMPEAFDPHT